MEASRGKQIDAIEFINLKGNSPVTGWKVSRPARETEQYQIKLQNDQIRKYQHLK